MKPIDISPTDLETVRRILDEYVPEIEVKAFGSRVSWTARETSDLDLALMTSKPLDIMLMAEINEAFTQSNLPFRVDILDWASISKDFRMVVEKKHSVIQQKTKKKSQKEDEWCEIHLNSVAELIMGQSPPSSTYNKVGEGLPFFQGAKDFNYRHPLPKVFCSAPSRIAQPGDILLSVRAPIGRVNIADRKCATGRGLAIIRPHIKSDARYIEFLLTAMESSWDAIEGSGSVFGNVTRKHLETLPLLWPHRKKRNTIAHILGTLDDKIELNRCMNKTLEAMARAIFKDWFVDFGPVRAKMENRTPYLAPEIWGLFPDALDDEDKPVGWELSEIGKEIKAVGGSTPSTKEPAFWEGGMNYWATPKDLSKLAEPVLFNTDRNITDAGVKKISSGILPVGTVLLSSRAPIGYLAIAAVPTAVNQGFIAMVCEKRLSNVFVLFWCHEHLDHIQSISGGSTFAEISKKEFRPIPVVIPSEQTLAVYDGVVRPLYDRIVANTKESTLLAQIRNLLLPKLVSGEIRIVEAGKVAEAAAL